MNIRALLTVLVLTCLAGCAAQPTAPPLSTSLFMDAAFKPANVRIVPGDALALSPEMQAYADNQIRTEVRTKGLRDGLIDALYTKGLLQLDYDSAITRTAAEAFEARRGNCLSLVLMTAAFARYFDLPVSFNSVYIEESWTRSNGLYFAAGHVNLSLSRIAMPAGHFVFGEDSLLTIDFLPPELMRSQRTRVIDETTILAMYSNNRAAEALVVGQVDDAYWWTRAAIEADPRWLSSYNTLAVLYRRKGLNDRAESTLRLVLDREPLNTQALSNLVLVLADAGRRVEAKSYADKLAQIQPVPPYRYFDEGVAAMRAGNFTMARDLFRKEIDRAAYVSEFHFWLALASYGMGDISSARGEIAKALENSTTLKDRELYSAKADWLNDRRRR